MTEKFVVKRAMHKWDRLLCGCGEKHIHGHEYYIRWRGQLWTPVCAFREAIDIVERAQRLLGVCEFDDSADLIDYDKIMG